MTPQKEEAWENLYEETSCTEVNMECEGEGVTTHFHAPTWAMGKQNRVMAHIPIIERKKLNDGKCSCRLLFERNAPFWSDLQLKFSIAVGETEKQMLNF